MHQKSIKIVGKIMFTKTDPRTEPWVTKKLDKNKGEHDYFLSLKIIKIGDSEVKTTQDAFNVLKAKFPQITFQNQTLNDLFINITLPRGAEDITHITLGNFPDFRIDRDVAKDVDKEKVAKANSLESQIVEFEISQSDFELVATCNVDGVNLSKGEIAPKVSTVGFNRDAVLNIKPLEKLQEYFKSYSKKVFGDDFELWNSQKQVVPYHITVAQTNQLAKTLDDIKQQSLQIAETRFAPTMM